LIESELCCFCLRSLYCFLSCYEQFGFDLFELEVDYFDDTVDMLTCGDSTLDPWEECDFTSAGCINCQS
jgi:hypothetical protein